MTEEVAIIEEHAMTDQSAVTFGSFALDCADPAGVAQFYGRPARWLGDR